MSLKRKGLYEEILRRFIDGIVKLVARGHCVRAIVRSYDGMRIRKRNFDSHEDIAAYRTEGLGILRTGSL